MDGLKQGNDMVMLVSQNNPVGCPERNKRKAGSSRPVKGWAVNQDGGHGAWPRVWRCSWPLQEQEGSLAAGGQVVDGTG